MSAKRTPVRSRAPGRRGKAAPAARFVAPRLDRRMIRRDALVARVHQAATPVVAVIAPAGYGKTSLLAEWAASLDRPSAWLTLDRTDNDPGVLTRDLGHGITFGSSSAVDRVSSSPVEIEAVTFAWRMADPLPAAFIIDRLEELVDVRSQAMIADLILDVPDGTRLMVASRRALPFETARLIAEGRLTIIGMNELALDETETEKVMRTSGIHLAAPDITHIRDRTEGWPAGLRLAGAWLGNRAHDVADLAGDSKLLSDYLQEEALTGLSSDDVDFLIRTSVLDRLGGPICDDVLRTTGSWEQLERFERSGAFLWSDDDHVTWYRAHPLFREMLRAELDRREPDAAAELLGRAAGWCEDNGYIEDAARYAMQAEDEERLLHIVRINAQRLFQSGKGELVDDWLRWLRPRVPAARFGSGTVLAVWTQALLGHAAEVDRWFEMARHLPPAVRAPDGSGSLRPWLALVDALLCTGGVEKMRDDAEAALRDVAPASPWYPVALLHVGIARLLRGEVDAADDILVEAIDQCENVGTVNAGIVALSERVWIAVRRGDRALAGELAGRAGAIREEHHLDAYASGAFSAAISARVAMLDANLPEAKRELALASRMRPALTYAIPWLAVQALTEMANVRIALADSAGARTMLREIDAVLRRRPDLGVLPAEVDGVRDRLEAVRMNRPGATALTAAEIRLLPLLVTHLPFPAIADRLYLSKHTIKTQAISIYRKLDATSRMEAVARARELGLVEDPPSS